MPFAGRRNEGKPIMSIMRRGRWASAFFEIGIPRREMLEMSDDEFLRKCAFILSLDFVSPPAYSDDDERELEYALIRSMEQNEESSPSTQETPSEPKPARPQTPPAPPPPKPKPQPKPAFEAINRFREIKWPSICLPDVDYAKFEYSGESSSSDSESSSSSTIPDNHEAILQELTNTTQLIRAQDEEYARAIQEAQQRERETEAREREAREQEEAARMQEQHEQEERNVFREIAQELPPEPADGIQIAFTLQNGQRMRRKFAKDTLADILYFFIIGELMKLGEETVPKFTLKYPGGELQTGKTLEEQNIRDRTMFQISPEE